MLTTSIRPVATDRPTDGPFVDSPGIASRTPFFKGCGLGIALPALTHSLSPAHGCLDKSGAGVQGQSPCCLGRGRIGARWGVGQSPAWYWSYVFGCYRIFFKRLFGKRAARQCRVWSTAAPVGLSPPSWWGQGSCPYGLVLQNSHAIRAALLPFVVLHHSTRGVGGPCGIRY